MFVRVQVPPRVPYAGIAQLVEHDLAKVGVASSSLVSRSNSEGSLTSFLFCFMSYFVYILYSQSTDLFFNCSIKLILIAFCR